MPEEVDEEDIDDAVVDDLDDVESIEVDVGESFEEVEGVPAVDAVVGLMERGERDAWIARAELLASHAKTQDDPTQRARTLLVVSELYAICGEDERANAAAREARQLDAKNPLAHRQVRGGSFGRAPWAEIADDLDAEARVAPTPEARTHALGLAAEVYRLGQGDAEGARKRFDQLDRIAPGDLRASLSRLVEALKAEGDIPEVTFGDSADAIAGACARLQTLRNDRISPEPEASPYSAVLAARNGLRRRDIATALTALSKLAKLPALKAAASWLIASIAAPHAEHRTLAINSLGRVIEGSHGLLAIRSLAVRALEIGDRDSALKVAGSAGEQVLSPEERIAIAGLCGATLDNLPYWVERAAGGDYDALPAAISAFLSDPADGDRLLHLVGTPLTQASVMLARMLATHALGSEQSDVLREAARQLGESDEDNGSARAIALELAYQDQDASAVRDALLTSLEEDGLLSRERALAGALLSELAEDGEAFAAHLARARQCAPEDESSLRMALAAAPAETASALLTSYADATGPVSGAIALAEAALRLPTDAEAHDSLLRRAAMLAPELSIAGFAGLSSAVARGDDDAARFWLAQQRRGEPSLPDLVREALRVPDSETAERASLLEEAHRRSPEDYALRDLYEQAGGGDRAEWLRQRSGASPDIALEAALSCELDGNFEDALACLGDQVDSAGLHTVFAERYARHGHGSESVLNRLNGLLRQERDPRRRMELAHRISAMADADAKHTALRNALEDAPADLLTLHGVERLHIAHPTDGFDRIAMAISKALDDPEGLAHAMLATRLRETAGQFTDSNECVERAHQLAPESEWALRRLYALTNERGDHEAAVRVCAALGAQAGTAMDKATLTLRGAEARIAGGEDVTDELSEVLRLWPRHHVAYLHHAQSMERIGAIAQAAQTMEQLAELLLAPRERAGKLYRAATLWLSLDDGAGQAEGERLLEAVAAIDPSYEDTFERLQAVYLARNAKSKLADLLGARIRTVESVEQRTRLEVMRGRILVEAGSTAEAKASLAAALEASPDNADALSAYADVCATENDWDAVEQALIRLGRLVSEVDKQCALYLRLGELYDRHKPNQERAERAYLEVLKLAPDSVEARQHLAGLYLRAGDTTKAFEQQEALIAAASTPTEKCERVVQLADIYEKSGDLKQAEATLTKARRNWSKEPAPVAALYNFYNRNDKAPAAEMLLERAAADVRRGLGAGRFEEPLFGLAVMVAEMRGQPDAAQVAQAALHAIKGERVPVTGADLAAGSTHLDALIAPDVFSDNFRNLLKATGPLMDDAVPLDLNTLRAKPLPPNEAELGDRTREIAAAYGLPQVEVFVSTALGGVCIPARTEPPTLVFGQALVSAPRSDLREFLIHRAVKVLQTHTGALSRTAPIDLWPLLGAYLKVHSPSFEPVGADPGKVSRFYQRMAANAPKPLDPQVNLWASEVIGSIGNRAASLNTVANAWGSRAALVATGDVHLGIEAIAWAIGKPDALPTDGPERVRWLGRQPEARDLIVFAVSEGHAALRERLGLADYEGETISDSLETIELIP